METMLSYAPRDFLMFGPDVYWRLFELQNRALWPLPVIAAMIAIVALALVATRHPLAIRAVLLLAALACLGAAQFLATRYAPINWPVIYAAWGFGLQAALCACHVGPSALSETERRRRYAEALDFARSTAAKLSAVELREHRLDGEAGALQFFALPATDEPGVGTPV